MFDGVAYAGRGLMCRARRDAYVRVLESGSDYTRAARLVGGGQTHGQGLAQRARQGPRAR